MLVLAVVMMMTTAGACRRSDPSPRTGSDTPEPVAATPPAVGIRYDVLASGRSTEFAASQPAMSAVVSCRDDAARTELVGKLGLSRAERDSVLLRRDDAIVVVFGPQVQAGGGMQVRDAAGEPTGDDTHMFTALDDVMRRAGAENIRAVNMSIGDSSRHLTECLSGNRYDLIFRVLRAMRVLPVVSAGNDAHDDVSGDFVDGISSRDAHLER